MLLNHAGEAAGPSSHALTASESTGPSSFTGAENGSHNISMQGRQQLQLVDHDGASSSSSKSDSPSPSMAPSADTSEAGR